MNQRNDSDHHYRTVTLVGGPKHGQTHAIEGSREELFIPVKTEVVFDQHDGYSPLSSVERGLYVSYPAGFRNEMYWTGSRGRAEQPTQIQGSLAGRFDEEPLMTIRLFEEILAKCYNDGLVHGRIAVEHIPSSRDNLVKVRMTTIGVQGDLA